MSSFKVLEEHVLPSAAEFNHCLSALHTFITTICCVFLADVPSLKLLYAAPSLHKASCEVCSTHMHVFLFLFSLFLCYIDCIVFTVKHILCCL